METQNWQESQLQAVQQLVNAGSQALRQGNVPAANHLLSESGAILDMCEEQDGEVIKLRARVLNELGVVQQRQNRPDLAEQCHREAAIICEELIASGQEFRGNGAATHLNLASIATGLGKFEEAEAAGKRALELVASLQESGEAGTEMLEMGGHQTMALIAVRQSKWEEGDAHMDKALEAAMKVADAGNAQIRPQMAQGAQQISVLFFEAQRFEEALKWGRQAETLSEKAFEEVGQAVLPVYVVSQINLISYYERMGRYADAEDCLWKAVEVAGNEPQILRRGQMFYETCRKQADNRLQAGNLPRPEVEDGLADLVERIKAIGGLPEVNEVVEV